MTTTTITKTAFVVTPKHTPKRITPNDLCAQWDESAQAFVILCMSGCEVFGSTMTDCERNMREANRVWRKHMTDGINRVLWMHEHDGEWICTACYHRNAPEEAFCVWCAVEAMGDDHH